MKRSPVIIVGMHRSGTTLLARLLKDAGLWIGNDLIDTWESRFFLQRHEMILNASGGSWSSPQCLETTLAEPACRSALVAELKSDARSWACAGYLGWVKFIKHGSLFDLEMPWGWKEPRTTLLLPLYLELFPDARVIHVYRNGVDVAASLARRERHRVKRVVHRRSASEKLGAMSQEYRREPTGMSLLHKYFTAVRLRYHPVEKYFKYGVRPISDLEHGFRLWRYYVQRYRAFEHGLAFAARNVRYEAFLASPRQELANLLDFCGLEARADLVARLCDKVDAGRRYAFQGDEALREFYRTVRDDPLMTALGYGDL
jgi:hypothetical protein